MEENENNAKKQSKKIKTNTTPIRVLKSTAKNLKSLVQKLNKKPLGKKVRIDDLLMKSLELLEEKHFNEIKDATLSNTDKLEFSYREYLKNNENISKDEYIGQLLNGEVQAIQAHSKEPVSVSL